MLRRILSYFRKPAITVTVRCYEDGQMVLRSDPPVGVEEVVSILDLASSLLEESADMAVMMESEADAAEFVRTEEEAAQRRASMKRVK